MAKSKRKVSSDFRSMYLQKASTKNPESELEGSRMDDGSLPLEDHNWEDFNEQIRMVEQHYMDVMGLDEPIWLGKDGKPIYKRTKDGKLLLDKNGDPIPFSGVIGGKDGSEKWKSILKIYNYLSEHKELIDLHRGAKAIISRDIKMGYETVLNTLEFMKRNNLIPPKDEEPTCMDECDQYNYPYYT